MRSLMISANVSLQEEDGSEMKPPTREEIGGFPWAILALLALIGGPLLWFVAPFLSDSLNGWIGVEGLETAISLGVPAVLAGLLVYMGLDIVRSYRRAVANAEAGIAEEPQMLTGPVLWATVGLSLSFSVALFFIVPVAGSAWLERYVDSHLAVNIIEGLIRFALLIGYLSLISRMEDIRRVFSYHGAEHKTIHAHEQGLPLDVANIRTQPLEHIRCGTGFLLLVVLISIVLFSMLGRPSLFWLVSSRVFLVPVIAAIGFEIIRFGAKHADKPAVKALLAPGLILQRLTTREPEDDMLEVAAAAFKRVAARDGVIAESALNDGAIEVDALGRPLAGIPVMAEPLAAGDG
jgi:uncharacterized protein YqhQ